VVSGNPIQAVANCCCVAQIQGGQAMSHLFDAHVAYIKTISDLNQDKAELQARIKRLEEAGDALFELCDASPIQFELVDQIPQRLKAWEEAKEAKP